MGAAVATRFLRTVRCSDKFFAQRNSFAVRAISKSASKDAPPVYESFQPDFETYLEELGDTLPSDGAQRTVTRAARGKKGAKTGGAKSGKRTRP